MVRRSGWRRCPQPADAGRWRIGEVQGDIRSVDAEQEALLLADLDIAAAAQQAPGVAGAVVVV
jgi:hypothetical protein